MTAEQYRNALVIAQADVAIDSDKHPLTPFDGFGLFGFTSVLVTLEQVASLMRYQALMFNGEW